MGKCRIVAKQIIYCGIIIVLLLFIIIYNNLNSKPSLTQHMAINVFILQTDFFILRVKNTSYVQFWHQIADIHRE